MNKTQLVFGIIFAAINTAIVGFYGFLIVPSAEGFTTVVTGSRFDTPHVCAIPILSLLSIIAGWILITRVRRGTKIFLWLLLLAPYVELTVFGLWKLGL